MKTTFAHIAVIAAATFTVSITAVPPPLLQEYIQHHKSHFQQQEHQLSQEQQLSPEQLFQEHQHHEVPVQSPASPDSFITTASGLQSAPLSRAESFGVGGSNMNIISHDHIEDKYHSPNAASEQHPPYFQLQRQYESGPFLFPFEQIYENLDTRLHQSASVGNNMQMGMIKTENDEDEENEEEEEEEEEDGDADVEDEDEEGEDEEENDVEELAQDAYPHHNHHQEVGQQLVHVHDAQAMVIHAPAWTVADSDNNMRDGYAFMHSALDYYELDMFRQSLISSFQSSRPVVYPTSNENMFPFIRYLRSEFTDFVHTTRKLALVKESGLYQYAQNHWDMICSMVTDNNAEYEYLKNYIVLPAFTVFSTVSGEYVETYFRKDAEHVMSIHEVPITVDLMVEAYSIITDLNKSPVGQYYVFRNLLPCLNFRELDEGYYEPVFFLSMQCIVKTQYPVLSNQAAMTDFLHTMMKMVGIPPNSNELVQHVQALAEELSSPAVCLNLNSLYGIASPYGSGIPSSIREIMVKKIKEYVLLMPFMQQRDDISLLPFQGMSDTYIQDNAYMNLTNLDSQKAQHVHGDIDMLVHMHNGITAVFDIKTGRFVVRRYIFMDAVTILPHVVSGINSNMILASNPNILKVVHYGIYEGKAMVTFGSPMLAAYPDALDGFTSSEQYGPKYLSMDSLVKVVAFRQVFKALSDIYRAGILFEFDSPNYIHEIVYDAFLNSFSVIPLGKHFDIPNNSLLRLDSLQAAEKVAVYILGVFLDRIHYEGTPDTYSLNGFVSRFFDSNSPNYSSIVTLERDLFHCMTNPNPDARWTFEQLYNHPLFRTMGLEM